MAVIDITTMKGETPRANPKLLAENQSVSAVNCHFRNGVVSPMKTDRDELVNFKYSPISIFLYKSGFWFTWMNDVDVIRSPVANDAYGRVYYTGDDYPKVTSADVATAGDGPYPATFYRLGVPTPVSAPVIVAVVPPDDAADDDANDDETRYYTQTYVTAFGEEGAPSPASDEVTIVYPGSAVDLSFESPATQNNNIKYRRLYRSATSDTTADFLLVAEIPINQLQYRDNVTDAGLSATLDTYDYTPPPSDMIGLCMMSNGIAAGFHGNEVCFSEAFLPYAWKDSNKQTTENTIVGIKPIGTTLVVGTEGRPYIFSGITPDNITSAEPMATLACSSKRSMVAMDGYVLYASPNGLVSIDGSGAAAVATKNIIDPTQWKSRYNPSTIRAWMLEGEYFALFDDADGVTSGFIFNPESMDFRHIQIDFNAAYNEPKTDTLYVAKAAKLFSVESGDMNRQLLWRSKPFIAQKDTSFSCLRIMADSPRMTGVRITVDGVQRVNIQPGTLTDRTIKIPSFSGKIWQVEVYGRGQVDRITLSTSMAEMTA